MIAIKLFTRVGVKWSSVQISVVVAYIQTSHCFEVMDIYSLF